MPKTAESAGRMTLFFYGSNTFALRQQVAKMVAEYQKRTGSDFGLERVDGATIKPQELSATLQAAPFLAASRLVVVEGLSANKSAIKVKEMLAAVPESTVAVFVEPQVDRRTVVYKELSDADRAVEFKPLSQGQLVAWATAEIKRLGAVADRTAINELVDLVGEDQWRLSEEVNKLVNFDATITKESVRQLVVAAAIQSIFDLVEAMTAGRVAAALAAYHNLLDRRENELYILTMVQWQLRNLMWAQAAPSEMSQAELAKAAGISPYVAGKVLAARKRAPNTVVSAAYVAASDAEYDIKTGRTKPQAAVEQVIYLVAESVSKKA